MKKMNVQILLAAVLVGNIVSMQGMVSRSTQASRQLSQRPIGVRLRSDYNRDMYPTPASRQEQEEVSNLKVGLFVNPLREKRLQEQREKEQGKKDPFKPVVKLMKQEELDELDKDAQEEYIENLRSELQDRKRNNRWQWEGGFDPNGLRYDLMQVKYTDEKPKRKLLEYFDSKRAVERAQSQEEAKLNEEDEEIEEEQEKTEQGFWQRIKSLFSH